MIVHRVNNNDGDNLRSTEDRELDGEFSRDSFEGMYVVHEGGAMAEVLLFSKRGFREREGVSVSISAWWFYNLLRRRMARV